MSVMDQALYPPIVSSGKSIRDRIMVLVVFFWRVRLEVKDQLLCF